MKSPTQKDFNYMFQWMYHRIDPNHKFQKNIDQEVPPILKRMCYLFDSSITKSRIAAVGGQIWSTCLGLLHRTRPWTALTKWADGLSPYLCAQSCCLFDESSWVLYATRWQVFLDHPMACRVRLMVEIDTSTPALS
ncbi:HEC/Ndc80p family-domain-containing protein [Mariannaea sp. PMI_226]|nr:HEC/Ndc80p family-domain-containing protein [Mariannaea sp. PMI_226]